MGFMGVTLKEGLVFLREEAQQSRGRLAFSAWRSELGAALGVCTVSQQVSKDPLSAGTSGGRNYSRGKMRQVGLQKGPR